ncbi:MAG: hypothetical protein GY769_01275 [bacterium]|nr:hypothetical protein [bacterium]
MLALDPLPTVTRARPEEGHLQFMRRRLRHTSSGWTAKQLEDTELVAEADDNKMFWELIGIRVKGHPGVILGAVKFRRQTSESAYARQSLPSYLALESPAGDGSAPHQRALVSLEVPDATESVPEFLRELTGKSSRHQVLVDKALIQLVFDLRTKNPSIEKLSRPAVSVRHKVVLRTRCGHVISGDLLDLDLKLHRDMPFVALTMGVQHTIHGNIPLPALFFHRRSISMLLEMSGVDELEDKLACAPFRLENANPLHLILEG